ncbi:MAG: serine hydrolase domain-containing protein [Bacteroidota bacterium]
MRTPLLLALLLLTTAACQHTRPALSGIPDRNAALDSLNHQLEAIEATEVLPGFAVSVFTKDRILYQRGFGFADLATQEPYTPEHTQIAASITKTLVGVALMNALDEGLLGLDDDVNAHLPFRVVNPAFPEDRITLRMLASHTSSIADTRTTDKGYRFREPLDPETFPAAYAPLLPVYSMQEDIPMSDFLRRKLSPDTDLYHPEVFASDPPGSTYVYSNLGLALLAHIIEIATGEPFDQYTDSLILQTLGMDRSTWSLDESLEGSHVTYYNELYNPVPPYHIITYPDGGLYSSVADMTTYLQEIIRGGDGESDLLPQSAFQLMTSPAFEGLPDGLCWDLSFTGLVGHPGNDIGTATLMYFSPETGIGRILFTNLSIETGAQEDAFFGIYNTLFEYDLM